MTDPERISKRSMGLAAQLLQAGADEQPAEAAVRQTLAALGVSAAVVTTASAASAVASGAKATGVLGASVSTGAGAGSAGLGAAAAGGAVKAVSVALLVKWIGIGVLGGVGLAGVAAVATGPAGSPAVAHTATPVRVPERAQAPAPQATVPKQVAADLPRPGSDAEMPSAPAAPPANVPHVSANEPAATAPLLEVGAPLAAEVAYVDRARALLVAGQAEQGLALLRSYERDFPEARLLPEVLFLQLETCARLGRPSEARVAAQRLLEGFPKSPHASRARKLLFRDRSAP